MVCSSLMRVVMSFWSRQLETNRFHFKRDSQMGRSRELTKGT